MMANLFTRTFPSGTGARPPQRPLIPPSDASPAVTGQTTNTTPELQPPAKKSFWPKLRLFRKPDQSPGDQKNLGRECQAPPAPPTSPGSAFNSGLRTQNSELSPRSPVSRLRSLFSRSPVPGPRSLSQPAPWIGFNFRAFPDQPPTPAEYVTVYTYKDP
jgi:hypothetical protein